MIQPTLRNVLSWLGSIACLSLCATAPARAQYYVVQDLGALPGTNSSYGIGINQNSQVIGQSNGYGFLWNNGVMTQLGLSGGSSSSAFGLNDQGDVVGMSEISGGYHAFLRHATGTTTDLHYQLLGTVHSSQARAINNQGQIVGAATNSDGSQFGFFYDPATPGGAVRLETLGGNSSFAYALNKYAELAGTAENGLGNYRAVLYRGSNFAITDLGALTGPAGWSVARDINDSRQVVGWSQSANNSTHAFLWNPTTAAMQDLGTLSGATNATSYATGINNQGMVVGTAMSYNSTLHAFLWKGPGGMEDLNWLIPSASGWELSTAEAINDKNEIVGTGLFGGFQRAYKLAPMAVQSVTVSPSPVLGGKKTYATVTLNGVAPGDAVVTLSSTNPAVTAPMSLIIPVGSNSGTAMLTTTPVETATTGNIVATYNGMSQVGSVTVRPPVMSSLVLTPTYVRGGGSITGTFLLDGPVAAKTLVTLASNKPAAHPTESSLVLYPGEQSGTFTIDTSRVLTKITVTISATANGVTKTAQMVVIP